MRKKLFAVIMSAMMMITFMPTMAFADTYTASVTNWYDYSKADLKYVNSTDSADTYTEDGVATVRKADDGTFNGTNPVYVKGHTTLATSYYDFNFAKVTLSSTRISLQAAQAMFGPKFEKDYAAGLTFSVPTYVSNYSTPLTTPNPAAGLEVIGDQTKALDVAALSADGYKFKVVAPNYDFDKKYTEDQTFELAVVPTFTNPTVKFIGSVPKVKLTIKKESASAGAAEFAYADKFKGVYDGSEHTWEQVAMSGVTSTYEVFNRSTGAYDKVDSVKVKNAGTYNLKVTTKDSKNTVETTPALEVKKANKLVFGFKGTSFNVAGKVEPEKYVTLNQVTSDATANAATTKAMAKDKATILAFVKEAYDVEVVDNGAGTYVATLKVKEAKDYAAAVKKYAELFDNYNGLDLSASQTATFNVVCSIDFTKAPLSKVYKAKKGKLPKNKTFKIQAKASDGRTLVYKLTKGAGKIVINKATGKVTVKKGLKKGTYKVGVYAIDIDTYGAGEHQIDNSYTLKIKVK